MQVIALTYQNMTASFNVNVTPKKMLQLAITSMPEQITYVQGQELNISGMSVIASYDNGKSENVTDDELVITGYDENVVGLQTVFVEYGSMSDSFNVIVQGFSDTPKLDVTADFTETNIAKGTVKPENCSAGVILVAMYKDDVLVGIQPIDYDGAVESVEYNIPYTVKPDKIKAMLWDSLEGMKSQCDVCEKTDF